ncbi:hypothetical protein LEP1GSC187_3614 [Leptospira santarosai str. ZUN179]|uniref:Uncharacterized protein n=1 Tax=Leptospira santarosai str. ZUN179 TaxID=1049985 RepID=M6UTC5_9LEPT|nr:hypothetical protein LEP1GSC039_2209 [Leptospira santarosai str. 2000027870]EMO45996.1 hypothetical protein LEP1GSC187_3614 [Leptospira santarosai str. ZUN179]
MINFLESFIKARSFFKVRPKTSRIFTLLQVLIHNLFVLGQVPILKSEKAVGFYFFFRKNAG